MALKLYQLISESQMKGSRKSELKQLGCFKESELRRSGRERKEPKYLLEYQRNEYYLMGSTYLEDILGNNYIEDDTYPKRRRKNYRFDDSEDYEEGYRSSKKKQISSNKVEGLLEWKWQLYELPITINYIESEMPNLEDCTLYKLKTVKSIASQNLASIAEDIEALFINIQWGKKGQTIKDFQNLKIQNSKFMCKGLVFTWAPKQYVAEILNIMEKKGFVYVQNFEIINFDPEKAQNIAFGDKTVDKKQDATLDSNDINVKGLIKKLDNVDPCQLIADEKSQFFNKSKRTLLMFKKANNLKFELRHQRTCDVLFDMPSKLGEKCSSDVKAYIYNMIETLLPDCLIINQTKKNQFHFKMLELWADKGEYRRGWISIIQE